MICKRIVRASLYFFSLGWFVLWFLIVWGSLMEIVQDLFQGCWGSEQLAILAMLQIDIAEDCWSFGCQNFSEKFLYLLASRRLQIVLWRRVTVSDARFDISDGIHGCLDVSLVTLQLATAVEAMKVI